MQFIYLEAYKLIYFQIIFQYISWTIDIPNQIIITIDFLLTKSSLKFMNPYVDKTPLFDALIFWWFKISEFLELSSFRDYKLVPLMYRCGALNVTKMSHWIKLSFCDTAKTYSDFAWIVHRVSHQEYNLNFPSLCWALILSYTRVIFFFFDCIMNDILGFHHLFSTTHILWPFASYGSCFWGVSTMTVIPVRVTRGCIHFLSSPLHLYTSRCN